MKTASGSSPRETHLSKKFGRNYDVQYRTYEDGIEREEKSDEKKKLQK